jgi:hypothetical protein
VPCCWEHIQPQLKLPFDAYQKLTLMIKMELENVTDVVPKDDYEFQMNVSHHQIEEQVQMRSRTEHMMDLFAIPDHVHVMP